MPSCNRYLRRLLSVLLLAGAHSTASPSPAAESAASSPSSPKPSTNSAPVFHATLKAATSAAADDQALVLLVLGAEWCVPCKELKSKTLASPEFAQQAGLLHVAEIDVDADPETARTFSVSEVPTLALLAADGKILGRRTGFLHTAELLLWLKEARERFKQGKWEGTATGSKLEPFVARAAADRITTNDVLQLIGMLGDPDPAQRTSAGKLILAQREQAVGPLIDAMGHPYLGVRIAASELFQHLAPDALKFDPWQSPAELELVLSTLRKWWAETGKLPPENQSQAIDPAIVSSARGMIQKLKNGTSLQRTEAMSGLVTYGSAALPALRDAIKVAEQAGDNPLIALLEDVRWAILVPDTVEERAGGVRLALARGKGQERQAASTRLARAGRDAIPALADLVSDNDPLVVESAVRALSGIGGKNAIPAMAALLQAADSNLRMTAAQSLGHTKNTAAIKQLLPLFADPNEVVACAAITAVEEILAGRSYSSSRSSLAPETASALKSSLADPRWRVRATAAEVAGKLSAQELSPALQPLLEDQDGFVVKSALGALPQVGAAPDSEKIVALAQRHPGLRADAVQLLLKRGGEASVAVVKMYNDSPTEARAAILATLASANDGNDTTDWQPLLERAAGDADPRLRQAAAVALAAQPPKVAAAVVGPLLNDPDEPTRVAAAGAVLAIISGERVIAASSSQSILDQMEFSEMSSSSGTKKAKTNAPPATAEQIADWHARLQKAAGDKRGVFIAAARFVTGDTNSDLPVLVKALEQADKTELAAVARSAVLAAVLPLLPWPAGKPALDSLGASPQLFLHMVQFVVKMAPAAGEYILEPPRFRRAVDPATIEDLQAVLPRLLGTGGNSWSLFSARPVAAGLLDATNGAWRAAAVYVLARSDDPEVPAQLERGLADTNSWVRLAAVSGLAWKLKDRPAREQKLGPLLADADRRIAKVAAIGLLEPETRAAMGAGIELEGFTYEAVHAYSSSFSGSSDQRPLAVIAERPPFLATARERLAGASTEDLAAFALLLAQYGDFSGLDHLVESASADTDKANETSSAALAGISLSKDAKYLPFLNKAVEATKEDYELRKILQALRGMSGAGVRELRLEINKRLRQASQ